MNRKRRKNLNDISQRIDALKAELELLRDEEQEFFDNMPENMQQGERGTASESAVEAIESAMDELDSAMQSIEEASQ